jgi:hypothetical protein
MPPLDVTGVAPLAEPRDPVAGRPDADRLLDEVFPFACARPEPDVSALAVAGFPAAGVAACEPSAAGGV